MNPRVGIGYDVHRLVEDRKLFLGGVEIPYEKGLLGHSDGDVVIHAICDALLGAGNFPDIGELFPDTDPSYKGIRSTEILKKVGELIHKAGFNIGNIDTVIILEEPKMLKYKQAICQTIGDILNISVDQINIKAKTNETLGYLGEKKAIACYVVTILIKEEKKCFG